MTWSEAAQAASGAVAVIGGALLMADRVRGWFRGRGTRRASTTPSTSSAQPQVWHVRAQRIANDGTRPDPPQRWEVEAWPQGKPDA